MRAKIKLLIGRFWWLRYKKSHKAGLKGFKYNCQHCYVNCEWFECPCQGDEILVERWRRSNV